MLSSRSASLTGLTIIAAVLRAVSDGLHAEPAVDLAAVVVAEAGQLAGAVIV